MCGSFASAPTSSPPLRAIGLMSFLYQLGDACCVSVKENVEGHSAGEGPVFFPQGPGWDGFKKPGEVREEGFRDFFPMAGRGGGAEGGPFRPLFGLGGGDFLAQHNPREKM